MKFSSKILRLAAALLVTSTINVYANTFKNANEIPAPSRVGLNTPIGNATAVPLNAAPQPQNSTYMNLNRNSLTQPQMVAKPIKLDEVSLKQQTVTISNDDSHLVNVSQSLVNRVTTPFLIPYVVVNGGVEAQVVGQDVFLEMTSDQPVGIYIREHESIQNHSPVASLILIPKAIPQQNISILLDRNIRDSSANKRVKVATDYEDGLVSALSQAVLNNTPDGYSRSNATNDAIAKIGGVVLRPTTIYSGVDQNIYVYSAENTNNKEVELVETSFHHDGVRAIAFYPEIRLKPNAKTNVYIMADVGKPSTSD